MKNLKQKIFDVVWEIMSDHYFEGSTGKKDDIKYAEMRTKQIIAIIVANDDKHMRHAIMIFISIMVIAISTLSISFFIIIRGLL